MMVRNLHFDQDTGNKARIAGFYPTLGDEDMDNAA